MVVELDLRFDWHFQAKLIKKTNKEKLNNRKNKLRVEYQLSSFVRDLILNVMMY
jgi:hypothetical protein